MRNNILNTLSFCLILMLLFSFVSCDDMLKNEDGADKSKHKIIETGELAAVNARAFPLARYGRYWYQMKVIGILEHGSIVNEGDSIIQLDPTEIKKFIIDKETDLERQLATLQTLKVNQENKRNDLQSAMKSELASFSLKKIELESSRFEAERIKKIKQLEFKQAEIALAKEKRKIELNDIVEANDYKIQEIRVKQVKTEVENAYAILPNLTIRTPISGVFQIAWNWDTNSLVKVGDQIYTGNNMASVPELKWMKVNTYINETDFLRVKIGQKVIVRLDAMPTVAFDGEVAYLGKLCHLKDNKSKQKVFDVEIKMLKSDERLKPGMTVSCEYL